jgi:hypothetical protein
MGSQPLHALVIATGEVSHAGPFHLDHAGTQIGKLTRRKRGGDGVFERDDCYSS